MRGKSEFRATRRSLTIVVPCQITLDSGKEYEGGKKAVPETSPLLIDETLRSLVKGSDAPWIKYIPEDYIKINPPIPLRENQAQAVNTNIFLTGDSLQEDADWDAMAERIGRKLTGYDMEGYGFYSGCERYLGGSKKIFVKGVSDYASKDTKVPDKSYQKYCCGSATAFICYLSELGKNSLFGTAADTDKGISVSYYGLDAH